MTQQDKDLLLRDLSARLPYGVILQVGIFDNGDIKYHNKKLDYHSKLLSLIELDGGYYLNGLLCKYSQFTAKPYLRPMSSMSEEECDTVEEILGDKCIFDFMGNGDIILKQGQFSQNKLAQLYDYYNSIHVDYRGLIEENLAVDCTGLYIYDLNK